MSVEVDELLGVGKSRARTVAAQDANTCAILVIDVFLGHPERIEVAGEPVVADRCQDLRSAILIRYIEAMLDETLDLLLHGQPVLGVLDHEPFPPRKKISPRLSATG